jgi:imidazole glycerol-phosphate synthase subunit HisH
VKEIVIVDYNLGNITSIQRALSYLGYKSLITNDPEKIARSEKIILPGVGAFPTAMKYLQKYNLVEALNETVKKGNHILGICLGMQLLMQSSNEFIKTKGLSFINGEVISINDMLKDKTKLPCIGWYKLNKTKKNAILEKIHENQWFYFVHSYMVNCKEKKDILADYSINNFSITAIIKKENITGLQFHPENSGLEGLKFFDNFCKY